jgi:hypothetical protein
LKSFFIARNLSRFCRQSSVEINWCFCCGWLRIANATLLSDAISDNREISEATFS